LTGSTIQKIKKLSAIEAQKIAAGEVVQRPANIVKELIENALDAQSNRITIYINEGGKSFIRVVDNGCGMSAQDVRICFERHATSKLQTFDDLTNLTSFGFRGEALASIAAATKVTLTSKETTAQVGTTIVFEYGNMVLEQEAACNAGTDITITDLFSQMPARKKFLKADQTEARLITQLVQAFCLSNLEVHFMLYTHNEQSINCPPAKSVLQRCTQLWNHHTSNALLDIQADRAKPNITIHGLVSGPQLWKYDRTHIFIFVNSRWIKNQRICTALIKGFNNVLPNGKFPIAFLNIAIDPTDVDINVHPRKEEVAFVNPRIVEEMVEKSVKKSLENRVGHLDNDPQKNMFTVAVSARATSENSQTKPGAPVMSMNDRITDNSVVTSGYGYFDQPFVSSVVEKKELPMTTHQTFLEDEYCATVIGQFNKTYIVIEKDSELHLIDQHAAHERILYEQFSDRFKQLESIKLVFPDIIYVSAADLVIVQPYLSLFGDNGIVMEQFGDDQIIISAVPVHLKQVIFSEIVHQLIGWIKEEVGSSQDNFVHLINEKLRAQMACKGAVKAGDQLSIMHMKELICTLYKTNNRFSCPHGRPTMWPLTLTDIERKFKRRN